MALSAQSRTNSGSPQSRVFGGDLTNGIPDSGQKHVAFGSPARVKKPKECPRSDTKVRKLTTKTTRVTIDGQALVCKILNLNLKKSIGPGSILPLPHCMQWVIEIRLYRCSLRLVLLSLINKCRLKI